MHARAGSNVDFRSLDSNDAGFRTLMELGTHQMYHLMDTAEDKALKNMPIEQCDRWIYNRDYGYDSMTSNVRHASVELA